VSELASEIAVREMNVPDDDHYQPDPRQNQWNSLDQRRHGVTWSDHGSYPRVDRYGFYYSYHSILSLASKLLAHMPVIRQARYDYADRWTEWQERYSLTRSDGKWLADRRDPAPINRRAWVAQENSDTWLRTIQASDFFDALLQSSMDNSVCVGGFWRDHKSDHVETISIASALVKPETASSLANALRSCEPNDFRLPLYGDEQHEILTEPFELTGWLIDRDASGDRLDNFDPYACEIPYPPIDVGEKLCTVFSLSADSERREWRSANSQVPALICQLWSQKDIDERDEPFRAGNRISASINFLKSLCAKLNKALVLEVRIRRDRHKGRYYRRDEEEVYVPDSHKIFIFSANGLLKDSTTNHQLG
jgi:hypothetical protein